MSSWLKAKSVPLVKKLSSATITTYHDTISSNDIPTLFMNLLGAYIYSQKMGELCTIFDETTIVNTTLKYNPQMKFLKERPENGNPLSVQSYRTFTDTLKFKDVQKYATQMFEYEATFNKSVLQVLEKASIKSMFDFGVHIIPDASGAIPSSYTDAIRAYQKRSKKTTLSVYVMADSYSSVVEFQKMADPSWKIVSLSKTIPKDAAAAYVQMMAEIQIMTVLPAVLLDFSQSVDRFIFLLQRNRTGYEYFKELNGLEWTLL
jgi:hypothetical protein